MASNRLVELDAIRGLAALAVVVYHYFFHFDELYGHSDLPVAWSLGGQAGVQLFFMVSGFVIYWSLHNIRNPMDFVVSRFSRLYPGYWLGVALTFTIVSIWSLPNREVALLDAIVNLTMFQEFFGIPNVDGVYWTLAVELKFYVAMLAIYSLGQLQKAEWILFALIAANVAQATKVIDLPEWIVTLFMFEHIAFFVMGMAFYKLCNHCRHAWMQHSLIWLALASMLSVSSLRHFAVYSLMVISFYLIAFGKLRWLAVKPLMSLGAVSYALYLIHQNIGYVIIREVYAQGGSGYVGVGLAISASLLIAFMVTYWLEKPALAFIRNIYKTSQWRHSMEQRFVARSLV